MASKGGVWHEMFLPDIRNARSSVGFGGPVVDIHPLKAYGDFSSANHPSFGGHSSKLLVWGGKVKIVVIKSPKIISGILRFVFGIKKETV